ncbi:AAA family ATPase [Kitasatospora cystarginea]|uniref:AAA family ATPase n=1 Tax=Kitasatospora cystarginea TaxID=58350 RepID=UPI0031CFA658
MSRFRRIQAQDSANPRVSARTDSKASLLLGITGVLIAGVAALGKAPAPALALALAAVGIAAAVASALLSVLVVMPKLDPTRSNGFSRWARCTDPDAIRQALADDVRLARLHALSVLCERKMRLLQLGGPPCTRRRPRRLRRRAPVRRRLTTHHPTPEAPTMTTTLDPVEPGDLVVMIGASGSGKFTTLLTIPPHQIVSLDQPRAVVSEPGDQAATPDAVLLQHQILSMRLRRGLTTFVDNVSCESHHRLQLVELAHAHGRRAVAILTDAPLDLCLTRNSSRPDHQRVPEDVLRWQHRMACSARDLLPREGFDEIRHHRVG